MRKLPHSFCLFTLVALSACATDQRFDTAVDSFAKGDMKTADVYAHAAEVENPAEKKVLALEGWINLKKGDLVTATKYLARLQAIDPDYIETIQLTAWVNYGWGNLAAADKAFHDEKGWAEGHRVRRSFPRYYSPSSVEFINNIWADGNTGLGSLALGRKDYAAASDYFALAVNVPTYLGHAMAMDGLAAANLAPR